MRLTRNQRVMRDAGQDEVPLSSLQVIAVCSVCFGRHKHVADVQPVQLVSPQGTVHEGAEYGMTACSRDATGPGWWWRL